MQFLENITLKVIYKINKNIIYLVINANNA